MSRVEVGAHLALEIHLISNCLEKQWRFVIAGLLFVASTSAEAQLKCGFGNLDPCPGRPPAYKSGEDMHRGIRCFTRGVPAPCRSQFQ